MPIEFTCSCGRRLRVSDEAAGQEHQCPACGRMVVVPGITDQPGTAAPYLYRCEMCGGDFRKDEVYDDRGRIICHRCYDRQGAPPRRGGRWDEGRYSDYPDVSRHNIPSHLPEAILVTLFCCWLPGIVAIVYAAQVGGKAASGDIEGARQASQNAATWSWVSFGVGLVIGIGYIAIMASGGAFR
jgi:hypothetical protein